MVELAAASTLGVVNPPTAASLPADAAIDASIARYLGAGERASTVMVMSMRVCIALLVLVVVAWALGLLPVAIRLF
jgi:hypothetical protein